MSEPTTPQESDKKGWQTPHNETSPDVVYDHPQDEDAQGSEFQQSIEKRYDELLAERERLLKEAKRYEIRDYDSVLDEELLDDNALKELVDDWLKKVRSETSFLKPLEEMGIEIFKDDLEDQPSFPGETIQFDSEEIQKRQLQDLTDLAGVAKKGQALVQIGQIKPTLRTQLYLFLITGAIDRTTATLVHELIHRRHLRTEIGANDVLNEAHAYFCGIFVGAGRGVTDMAHELTLPTKGQDNLPNGLYEYDNNQVIEALLAIATLYGAGMTSDEISRIVTTSYYDSKRKTFNPLYGIAKAKLNGRQIDAVDTQALNDLFLLHANNQRLHAQMLLYQSINERFSPTELREAKKKGIKKKICRPSYYDANGDFDIARSMQQAVILPGNDLFPYDPNGQRAGIIFGLFSNPDDPQRSPVFSVGRYEAQGRQSSVALCKTTEEEDSYIELLRGYARDVALNEKSAMLDKFSNFLKDEKAQRVVKAIINQQERKEIVGQWAPRMIRDLQTILEELEIMKTDRSSKKEGSSERIMYYKEIYEQVTSILQVLDLDPNEIDPQLAALILILEEKFKMYDL